ncbi:ATP synthase-coupling factor 6, mitochondrial [Xylocopa sonorina]|uniref:ATP synthase-coupling factor 6, mitochondrial n=1 Tax=Xylocopa sonorina TaxID=1818115 RepID=UPI00403AA9E2
MLTQQLVAGAPKVIKRNIGILAPSFQEAKDPIQQLFINKIREYKSKSAGGKLVDATPEIEKERRSELDRIRKQYNIQGDVSQFPSFNFQDPVVEK